MKKYEGNIKKYVGNMKMRTLPIHGPWDLEKFRVHPLISRGGGVGGDSKFPCLGVPQRKDMKHVKLLLERELLWLNLNFIFAIIQPKL